MERRPSGYSDVWHRIKHRRGLLPPGRRCSLYIPDSQSTVSRHAGESSISYVTDYDDDDNIDDDDGGGGHDDDDDNDERLVCNPNPLLGPASRVCDNPPPTPSTASGRRIYNRSRKISPHIP